MATTTGLRAELVSMAQAAETVLDIPLGYALQGRNLAQVALAGSDACLPLQHYPRNDVVDVDRASRYYYHAHTSRRRPAQEHGHFHLFAHGQADGGFMHLAALSLNHMGEPLRWFTINCWVTGERWHPAPEALAALEGFQIRTVGRLSPVARWLSAMVRLFLPQLRRLVRRRDAIMRRRCMNREWSSMCQDRRIDVVSQCSASLPQRIQQFQHQGGNSPIYLRKTT